MPMLAPWYTHDVYVSYYHGPRRTGELGVGDEALNWIRNAIVDLQAMLRASNGAEVAFYDPVRNDALNPALSGADTGALEGAAVWLVFLTPEYGQSAACIQEAKGFLEAMKRGPRSQDQLVICELLPLDANQKAALPWHEAATPGVGTPAPRRLYHRYTMTIISDGDKIASERRALAGDLKISLEALARIQEATDKVPRRTGPLDQVYLFNCLDQDIWKNSWSELASVDLAVIPAKMEQSQLVPRKERQKLRERRRQLLENSIGLVVLRSSLEEDLEMLAAETAGDMKCLEQQLPAIFVDWMPEPQAAWPYYFVPERVYARNAGWAATVAEKLRAMAGTGGPD